MRDTAHCPNEVDESLEMHRHVGGAAADPPDPMGPEARHCQERDFTWACRIGHVENAQACRERLLRLYGVDQRFGIVILLSCILLHGPDVGAVDGEQYVTVNLQMV